MFKNFPEAGTVVDGTYLVRGLLGSGAMGVVLEAEDVTLGRSVAMKFIHPNLIDDAFRKRFREEAQAMARVNHPHALRIYAFGEHDGAPYFVMEHVDGMTLDGWVSEKGLPSPRAAMTILAQICDGVAAMHAANTVHRDLKPSNVLIDRSDFARVADLGLAVFQEEGGPRRAELVGTPGYMAPEIAFPDANDIFATFERADVYSLGCVAYELLTGSPPFVAENHTAMMFQHATVPIVLPSVRRPGLPKLLDDIVLRAMAKRPVDRTPTVAALGAAFRAAAEGFAEPVRILVAEDNDDFRSVLALALSGAFPAAEIDCVADGRDAIVAFDARRPSVAILDLLMPEVDGTEVTRHIRTKATRAEVPIIVLTASGGPADWKRLSAIGADRFFVKPVNLDDVITIVRHLLWARPKDADPPS